MTERHERIDDLAGGALELGLAELLRHRLLEVVTIDDPAASSDFSDVVPGEESWELLTCSAILTTDATAGNRSPRLRVTDENGVLVNQYPAASAIAPSTSARFGWASGLGGETALLDRYSSVGFPPPVLFAGWKLETVTDGIAAGDQWSSIALVVRKWSLQAVVHAAEWYGRRNVP